MAFQTTTLTSAEYETKTLETRVLEWTEQLCEALAENYKQHSIRMYQGGESDYSKKQLESVEDGTWKGMKFVIKNGKNSISASSGYKLVGDAVPPLLSYKIIKKIEKILSKYP